MHTASLSWLCTFRLPAPPHAPDVAHHTPHTPLSLLSLLSLIEMNKIKFVKKMFFIIIFIVAF